MNCAECRDNLVACAEGVLEEEASINCKAHLEGCAECRAEYAAITKLQHTLIERGRSAAELALVAPVMRRVLNKEKQTERNVIMRVLLRYRWGFGLGTAAAAALFLITLFSTSKIQAAAVEVMSKGAEAVANLSSIHFRGQLRTAPRDNFSSIMPDQDFVTVEFWKEFGSERKWRAEKPGRVAVMDGKSTVLFIKPDYAHKIEAAAPSAYDTQWLHELADLNRNLNNELSAMKLHGWPVTLTQKRGIDGKAKSVITVEATSGLLTGDYLKNKFFSSADTRRVYVFDDATRLLESVHIYMHGAGSEKLIFELTAIDYNPSFESDVFQLQLPTDVAWDMPLQMLPDNEKYAAMTPEQAARAFFEACGASDWKEAAKFGTVSGTIKKALAGVEIIRIGKSFTSATSIVSGAHFVPYEIRLANGQVKKFNLALKRDGRTQRWYVDGGI